MAALDSLYETAEGWLAVVVANDAQWQALKSTIGDAALDSPDFASAASRLANDKALRAVLQEKFLSRSAGEWFTALNAAGVPVEISDPTFGRRLHDMAEFRSRNWTVGFRHELVGQFEQTGLCVDFSETPGTIKYPPLVVGEFTREVLRETGYSDERIDALHEERVAGVWNPGEPMLSGPRKFIGYKEAPQKSVSESAVAPGNASVQQPAQEA
jgi:crotonobetainyl-CoA:carnitine CoA-transferase CaiB-like acyl-CoA transferase